MNIKMKILFISVVSCLLIYIVSPLNGFQKRALANDSELSTIGGIPVGDLNEEDIKKLLAKEIAVWQSKSIVVSSGETSINIDPNLIQYNIDESIAQYIEQSEKSWIAFWQKKPVVQIPLIVLPNEQIKQQIAAQPFWESDATYNNVMMNASYLRKHDIEAVVSKFTSIDKERIAVSIKELPATVPNVQVIIDQLNDVIIQSGEEFSLLAQLDSLLGSASRETINLIASVLYETALKLTAQITERHQHQVLPDYLNPGLDAYVQASVQQDLRFINTFNQPVQLRLTREGLNLKVEFFAAVADENATVRVNRDGEVKPRVITRYSNKLSIGQRQLIQEGVPGLRVTVYRTNTVTGQEQFVSRDYYPPTNQIVLESSLQPVVTEGSALADGSIPSGGEDSVVSEGEKNLSENGEEITDEGSSTESHIYDKGGKVINSSK